MFLNRQQCEQLKQHLFDGYGWDKDGVSDRKLSVAIEQISASEKMSDQQVIDKLSHDIDIQKKLLDELVIPETYFFRYPDSFEYLKKIAKKWLLSSTNKPLNIASIPCATGEEPYSIAIMLLEAGLFAHQFNVDALDISLPLLTKANEGVYAENRVSRHELINTADYFENHANGLKIKPTVKESINFIHGNITELPSSFFQKKYDVIFCRNLLIYLSDENRIKLFNQLKKLLNSNGIIMVGPVEVNFFRSQGMHSTIDKKVYALTFTSPPPAKKDKKYKQPENNKKSLLQSFVTKNITNKPTLKSNGAYSLKTSLLQHNKRETDDNQFIAKKETEHKKNNLLNEARTLANSGLFKDALLLSTTLITQSKSSDIYLLHAEILMALAQYADAINAFKKVLYIAPKNQQALQHLTLLLNKLGDKEQAVRYQTRLQNMIEGNDEQ